MKKSLFVWPHHASCGILVPRPGMEPTCPVVEGRFLTTGPPGSPKKTLYLSEIIRKGHQWCADCQYFKGLLVKLYM